MSSCMTYDDEFVSWEFDENTEYDGWLQNKFVAGMNASGALSFKIAGVSPALVTAGSLGIDAQKVKSIDIALKNNTAGKKLKLSYITKANKVWSNNRAFEVSVKPNDGYDNVYSIDVSSSSGWKGIIDKLKLEFEGRKGDISIDYIRLKYITE